MLSLEFNPEVDFKLLLLAPLIPFCLYIVQIFVGRLLPRKGDWMLTSGMFISMLITVYMAAKAIRAAYIGEEFQWQSHEYGQTFDWIFHEGGTAQALVAGVMYDGLGAAMLAVVGIVSFCVHLFSMGYMHGDRRYHIFFANISLFTFAMLGLVLSDNFLFLFIFWEIMGCMSYLLIGHFSHDPTSARIKHASRACKKAFLTTRVGDVCLMIGIIMFYREFGTLRFTELWEASQNLVAQEGEWPAWMTTAGLFLFGGTVGKSAQFPLHIWLPDAMEGPTPVSAMIHAATMVAAGVFLLGRSYPMLSPEVLGIVATTGAITALFAATIGCTVNDIKGVLAYSTISQLGFMVAAIGVGGVTAGLFHMTTHAFFKACLFLSAGSVIHGCHHNQDMRYMGGLRKMMPVTFVCMLISTLAIAGIPLFSGFYSKDKIIMATLEKSMVDFSGSAFFAAIALPIAALLTSFYMFRLIFMTFFGEYRGDQNPDAHHGHDDHGDDHGHDDHHGNDHGDAHGHAHVPHESPWPMRVALSILAVFGLLGGHFWLASTDPFANSEKPWFAKVASIDGLYNGVLPDIHAAPADGHGDAHAAHADPVIPRYQRHLIPQVGHATHHSAHMLAVGISLFVALSGLLLAWFLYMKRRDLPAKITAKLGDVYTLVLNKYYVDEGVNKTVIAGSVATGKVLSWVDTHIVDGFVLLVGRTGKRLGAISGWIDRTIVDGLVNFVGLLAQTFGTVVRLFQTGRIQQYVTFAVAGGLLAAAWLILIP